MTITGHQDLQPGFYWLREDGDYITVAHWDSQYWSFLGNDMEMPGDHVDFHNHYEIISRLEEPIIQSRAR